MCVCVCVCVFFLHVVKNQGKEGQGISVDFIPEKEGNLGIRNRKSGLNIKFLGGISRGRPGGYPGGRPGPRNFHPIARSAEKTSFFFSRGRA